MARAIWNGTVLADSDDIVVVDGYTYFPRDAVNTELTARCRGDPERGAGRRRAGRTGWDRNDAAPGGGNEQIAAVLAIPS